MAVIGKYGWLSLVAVMTLVSGGCKTVDMPGMGGSGESATTATPNKQFLDVAAAQDLAVRSQVEMALTRYQETITRARVAALREDTLPTLLAQSAGYPGGHSVAIQADLRGEATPDPFATAWNSLDFGAAFVQSASWKPEPLQEALRKRVASNLMMQTRSLFWQSRMADELLPVVNTLFNQVQGAVDQVMASGSSNQSAYRELTELSSKILRIREYLLTRRREMAQLMGMPAYPPPRLEGGRVEQLGIDVRAIPPITLERYVMAHRPGLQEPDGRDVISLGRTRLSLMRLLPGLERRFHPRNEPGDRAHRPMGWDRAGTLMAKRLMSWFGGSSAERNAKNSPGEMAGTRRLAFQMAAVVQAHLALESLLFAQERYQKADREDLGGAGVDNRPDSFVRDRVEGGSSAEVIRNRVERLAASVRKGLAYAEYQVAVARFQTTAGMDLRSEHAINWVMNPLYRQILAWRESMPAEVAKEAPPPEKVEEAPPPSPPPPSPPPPPPPPAPVAPPPAAPAAGLEPRPMAPPPAAAAPPPAPYQPMEHSMMGQPPSGTLNFQNQQPNTAGPSYLLTPQGNLVPQPPAGQSPPPGYAAPSQQQPGMGAPSQQPPMVAEPPPQFPRATAPVVLDFTGGASSAPSPAGKPHSAPVLDFTGGER